MDKRASVVRSMWMFRAMFAVLPLLWVSVGEGQTTSITSSGLNTHVSHVAGQPTYDITGGTRPGNGTNLFHSFGDFSIGTDQAARFLNDSGLATTNILSRVTGGNPSNIFGEINTTNFPGANLYLINPAGVLFGATATLNVSGSVHVSTADYLRLADGLRFNAVPGPQDTLLSQAPVVAFGFLNAHPRPISVQGSQLTVAEGKGLSLVGGTIRMTGGALTAPGGQVNLASLAGRGEARVTADGIAIAPRTPRGNILVNGGPGDLTRFDTSGEEGGAIVIRGGHLSLAYVEATTEARTANHTGAGIVVGATDAATLDRVILHTRTSSVPGNTSGGAGPVSLTAPSMTVSDLTIDTSAYNEGPAGDVAINVGSLKTSLLQIRSFVHGESPGPASGNVSIRATRDITLQDGSIGTSAFGARDAGQVSVHAKSLTMTDGASIHSGAQAQGPLSGGRTGNIVIDVGRLVMQGQIGTSTLTVGHGGDINVAAKNAVIINRGLIHTETTMETSKGGEGGSITLSTPDLTLDHAGGIITANTGDAPAGDISISVRTLNMFNGGRISANGCCNQFHGSAGDINIVATKLISMSGVSDVTLPFPTTISSTTSSSGHAGRVHIVTPTMHLDDRAVVSTSSESAGHAGRVVLDVGRLDIRGGAGIESTGTQNAGTILINAARNITLDQGTITAAGSGQGGKVDLYAGNSIEIRNGSLISADNTGVGDAGHIAIQAGRSFVSRDSAVSAKAERGNGGTIDVDAKNVTLRSSQLTTSVSGGPQTVGGDIAIEATKSATFDNVVLRTGRPFSPDPLPPTDIGGGPVSLTAPSVRASNLTIDTSGQNGGLAGDVTINVRSLTASNLNLLNSTDFTQGPASGNISIHASGDVTLHNSGIGTDLNFFTVGQNRGHITVRAATLTLDRTRMSSFSDGPGEAGDIVIDVGRLTMLGSRIRTETVFAPTQGGNIRVSASEAILIDGGGLSTLREGPGGSITVSTPRLTLNHAGRISTRIEAIPTGGDISVNVETLNMFNGAGISTQNTTTGSTGNISIVASKSISMAGVGVLNGRQVPTEIRNTTATAEDAGRVHIVTPTMHVDDRAAVRVFSDSASGNAIHNLVLDVGRLNISRGARIEGAGVANTIVNAAKSITLDNGTITVAAGGFEQSGDVHLHAGKSINLRNGSSISADNTEFGDAAHIVIQAGERVVIRDSTVSARAERGNGGIIDVDAKNVTLTNSQLTTSVSGGPQTVGGQIAVDAKHLTLRNSQILSTATEGDGGTIKIRSHALHRDAKSVIDASSESGTDGTVIIEKRH